MGRRRKTHEQYMIDVIEVHGDRYGLSKVKYTCAGEKIEVICYIHGSFFPLANSFLSGSGCRKCEAESRRLSLEEFEEKAKEVHGDRYGLSKLIYTGTQEKIEVICRIHGSFFPIAENFLRGHGCKKCSDDVKKSSTKEFKEKARKEHGDRYGLSKVKYVTAKKKIEVICYIHGSFFPKAGHFLSGTGCPQCNLSKGEEKIRKILKAREIIFEVQKSFEKCKSKCFLFFDFYLPDYNLLIEYDGKQHFKAIAFFGGEKQFKIRQRRDKIKNEFAVKEDIHLLRIPYTEFKNIKKILMETLNKYSIAA